MANKEKKIERSCETCAFHESRFAPPPSIERLNICRRNPPTPVMIQTPQGAGQMSVFPMVTAESWCYQWTPDASKLHA